jgi:hypothetical protein
MEMSLQVHMINVHLGFLEEFSMDRIGPGGVYFFMALPLVFTICSYFAQLCILQPRNFAQIGPGSQHQHLSISQLSEVCSSRCLPNGCCSEKVGRVWDMFPQLTMQNLPDLIYIF